MTRKISDKTIRLIRKLYNKGLSISEMVRKAKVSYSTMYAYSRARKRGFASFSKYNEHLARERGFGSIYEYNKHRAEKRVNPETGRPFESYSKYHEHLVKQRVNPETGRKFESRSEYDEDLAKRRQRRLENKELSDLIKRRLKELGKNQSWLSRQINVSKESISQYAQGKLIPNEERLERLFSVLDVPYRTLEDLLER